MTYWQRLLAWLEISEPGTRKERVEDWLAANGPKLQALRDRQALRRRFFQRLRAWAAPTDDPGDRPRDLDTLPAWCDLSIDVYEAPDGPRPASRHGWVLNIHVTELDASEWTLRIDSTLGSLGWTEKPQTPIVP